MSDWEEVPVGNSDDWEEVSDSDLQPKKKYIAGTSQAQTALEHFGKGLTLGLAPHLQAGAERAVEGIGNLKDRALDAVGLDDLASVDYKLEKEGFKLPENSYVKARDENIRRQKLQEEANPKTALGSNIAGSVVSGIAASPLLGATDAATVLGRLHQAGKVGAAYGLLTNPGDTEGEISPVQLEDRTKNALFGYGMGALAQGGIEGALGLGNKVLDAGRSIISKLPSGKKVNADEIIAAAKELGIEPTPGMLSDSEVVQKLESSLHQSPTLGGYLTRKGTRPIGKGMESATKDLVKDAASVSPFESGEQVKKILANEVEKKFAPSIETFDDLAKYTKDIHASPNSVKAVSRNIMNIPEVDTLKLPFAKQIVDKLGKDPSASQIKMLRTMVGQKAKSAIDGAEKSAYWQMYAKLGKLEENTIKRGILNSARNQSEGNTIAKGMLDQLKGAKKGYSEQMGNLEDLALAGRLGKVRDPKNFINNIESIKSENLQEKLLPLEDVRLAQTMQKQFPEAFGSLRKARLRDLSQGIESDGGVVPSKFLRNTRDLNPETESMLFGEQVPKLNALRTVQEALPEKVGPSGTQQAFDVKDMLNPINQAKDLARYGAYKVVGSERLAKIAQFLQTKPQFQELAKNNPKAFNVLVADFAKKVGTKEPLPKVAGPNQQPVDEDVAKQEFLNGN